MEKSIAQRLAGLDWAPIRESLWGYGYALTPWLLTPGECAAEQQQVTLRVVYRAATAKPGLRFLRAAQGKHNQPARRQNPKI